MIAKSTAKVPGGTPALHPHLATARALSDEFSAMFSQKLFLVSDADLKKLGSMEKENPTRKDWGKMRLYLASQVEKIALRRHGRDGIDEARAVAIRTRVDRRQRKREREEEEERAEEENYEVSS